MRNHEMQGIKSLCDNKLSDQVILLYNPDYQDKSKESAVQTGGCERLVAKIAKNRIGGIGQIQFDYYKATQFIEESRR